MRNNFYNLSGGINQASTKTQLGMETNKIYWSDSKNVEILQNSGIVRQRGNVKLISLPVEEKILSIHPLKEKNNNNLLIVTELGNMYVYEISSKSLLLLESKVSGAARTNFVDFLDGVIVSSKEDSPFYINNDKGYKIESCNLLDENDKPIFSDVLAVYKGRVWVVSGATLYFSALGRYDDFSSDGDAGYINNFHTDTNDITALKTYKDYLAIYKADSVYLLSGSNLNDFAIVPFADKGTASFSAIATVNNKQYFINQGVFSLEQTGLLSQIQLGKEITTIIKPEFQKFDSTRFSEIIVLHYPLKNQVWYYIPYKDSPYFHTVWIYNYINEAWFKRVVPQNITTACICDGNIFSADAQGNIYKEDFGNTFDSQAIDFMWKSPFISVGDVNVRKTIEEFYFVLDESYDNNFKFSVYKDYNSEYMDDTEVVSTNSIDNLCWGADDVDSDWNFCWDNNDADNSQTPVVFSKWATSTDVVYKAEISESNYCVQLCVEGNSLTDSAAILGLQFKEVYPEE